MVASMSWALTLGLAGFAALASGFAGCSSHALDLNSGLTVEFIVNE